MKRFGDLTDTEILGLTEEQIERYIDIECAYKGIQLLPPMPTPPEPVEFPYDVQYYQVGDIKFGSEQAAAKVLSLIKKEDLVYLKWVGGFVRQTIEPLRDDYYMPKIETHSGYSPAMWEKHRKAMDAYDRAKGDYDSDKREYDKILEQRDEAENAIRSKIYDIKAWEQRRVRLIGEFERYVGLADGDKGIAWNFFAKANPDIEQDYPTLKDELLGTPGNETEAQA